MLVRIVIFCSLLALANTGNNFGVTHQPEFGEPLSNLTVPVGRDAIFRCLVVHLGGYRVGWVKADTKAIQAIHDHVITHNPRVSVSHSDHSTWYLHIRNVQEEDRGQYMCQMNTDPMKSQLGYLDVVVPPDFIPEETSGDVMVPEGGTVKLTCKARGSPPPHVQWRREDGVDITVRESSGLKTRVSTYQGEILKLAKITRSEMGAYLCIASNGVPPSVSKRIRVNVHFHPVIQVPNQLVGAPLNTDVTLECYVESSPKSINYWVKDSTGELIIPSEKYEMEVHQKSMFEARMSMSVKKIGADDLGSYTCVAKNSLGDVESKIRLYEIPGPSKNYASNRHSEGSDGRRVEYEDYPDEKIDDLDNDRRDGDEESNKVVDRANKWAASSSGNSAVGSSSRDFQAKMGAEGSHLHVKLQSSEASLSRSSTILGRFIFIGNKSCIMFICALFFIKMELNVF